VTGGVTGVGEMPLKSKRFPFPIPMSWYQVAYPSDLNAESPNGRVHSTHAFGRDIVVWRDDGGTAHTHDAYCPHLGAHVGVGGTVVGATIRCPFHGWRFDGDGSCAEIPYSDRTNRRAVLRSYPTIERNGLVFAWYHPGGSPPRWEIPKVEQFGDPEWTDYVATSYTIRSIPQEMGENSVDPAHFRYVHGTEYVATVEEYLTDGPRSVMRSKQGYVTPRGSVEGRIDVEAFGPGFGLTWFRGIIDALLVTTTTPVDDESTIVRFHFTVKQPGGRLADAFISEIDKQVRQDIPIWENKRYIETPALADTDGPIMRFRSWFRQFYAELNED
jgi:nitrite reductase/ring-hydroxylating ferredoxin subunit